MSLYINNSLHQSYELLNVATAQAKAGQFAVAEKTVASIPNPETRQLALGELVKQYVHFKKVDAALRHANSCEISRKIVQALAATGQTAIAIPIIEKIADPKEKSTACKALSEAFVKTRQLREAEKYAAFVHGPKRAELDLAMRMHSLTVST